MIPEKDKWGHKPIYKKGHQSIGKKHSETSKRKMSLARVGRFGGDKHPKWNGGRKIGNNGYVLVWCPDHPNTDVDGRILEHRLVMEKKLGRYLTKQEHVHHINHIRDDNRPENLQLTTNKEHRTLHKINTSNRICVLCNSNTTYIDKSKNHHQWYIHPLLKKWMCRKCYDKFRDSTTKRI